MSDARDPGLQALIDSAKNPCPAWSPGPASFDHPCKETCSGWKQGFEKGRETREGPRNYMHVQMHQQIVEREVKAERDRIREGLIRGLRGYFGTQKDDAGKLVAEIEADHILNPEVKP